MKSACGVTAPQNPSCQMVGGPHPDLLPAGGEKGTAVHVGSVGVTTNHSSVNAMMALPRLESIWTLPPAPTTMYCLPPTA